MSSFVSRNILLCVVPSIIALFSVYWFRRKKKFKHDILLDTASNTVIDSSQGINADQLPESNLDSLSDTLSDASSFASPEKPEKLSWTAEYSLNNLNNGIIQSDKYYSAKPISVEVNSFSNHTDVYDDQGLEVGKTAQTHSRNADLFSEYKDIASDILSQVVENCNCSDSLNKMKDEHQLNVNAQAFTFITNKEGSAQITDEDPNKNKVLDCLVNLNDPVYFAKSFDDSQVQYLKPMKSAINSEIVMFEKPEMMETNSNDSRSSVLDENSLSDDSETQSKNKGSLSSVLDGSSLCDDLNEESPSSTSDLGSHSIKDFEDITCQNQKVHINSVLSSPSPVLTNGIFSEVPCSVIESLALIASEKSNMEQQQTDSSAKDSSDSSDNHCSVSSSTSSNLTVLSEENTNNSVMPCTMNQEVIADLCSTSSSLLNTVMDDAKYSNGIADIDDNIKDEDYQIKQMNIAERLSDISQASSWSYQDIKGDEGSKTSETLAGQYVYEFELPQDLCGRLIGKQGRNVKEIKERSNANIYIKRHPFDPLLKLIAVEGNRTDVHEALDIIRRKYPPSRYPTVTLVKTNVIATNILPESMQLHLPEGASSDVILSSLVTAGHFFLQQPTHPTYPSLSTLDQCMTLCYSQNDTPPMPEPIESGVICAAPIINGWFRAQVASVFDDENSTECSVKFVDYGGFATLPVSTLRQIRSDFMSLPLQASECYLANVRPIDPAEGWSSEATSMFEELAQGQILQAWVTEYALDGKPCVHLYRVQGVQSTFINKELVERGLAIWVTRGHWADIGPAPLNYH